MTNRLGDALSPYLLQHAENPVDWYPWGDEALSRARSENKPILLSIGYSACHWCHVMERESFENATIAAQMNESFISIKVDREERPDLDKIYQTAVQLMTRRSGGWPLTVFLTPSLEPFYGGTYFPPEDRHGMPGFPRILSSVREAFEDRGDEIGEIASEVVDALRTVDSAAPDGDVDREVLVHAARKLALRFDERYGGFGDAPKFPNTASLGVMLRTFRRTSDDVWLDRVRQAVDAMIEGGIHDQLGGGFHRYSTDARWRVPHFEKMLYDNALIGRLLVDLWRVTREPEYRATCERLLEYVEREMTAESGGFFATQDADSEGREGVFFVWTPAQLADALGPEDGALATAAFGVDEAGNFEEGTSVLRRARTVDGLAAERGEPVRGIEAALMRATQKLFEARSLRPKPFRDEKIVTSWNAWMAGTFAEAGAAFDEPKYVAAAEAALRFAREALWDGTTLARVSKDGRHEGRGFLVDYAATIGAALDLYEATFESAWTSFAVELADAALDKFWNETDGLLYFAEGSDDLLLRTEDNVDGEVPAGSSSMVRALLRLDALLDNASYSDVVDRVLERRASHVMDNPAAFAHLAQSVDAWVRGPTHVLFVGEESDASMTSLVEQARAAFVPNRMLVRADGAAVPWLDDTPKKPGAYVCRDRTCSPAITHPDALREALEAP
ncbi:MAG: thioredoxin domain-containing protein [Myxococcota bacterium]